MYVHVYMYNRYAHINKHIYIYMYIDMYIYTWIWGSVKFLATFDSFEAASLRRLSSESGSVNSRRAVIRSGLLESLGMQHEF